MIIELCVRSLKEFAMNLQQNLNTSVLLGKQTQSRFQEDLTLKALHLMH